ncbi:glycerate kinase [Ruminococcaceae bacterium OttesenSCG-928-A11]|nr:glycerate kinase [Ruminococcaceae bacterium OttesenSCG-928-A11]
MKKVILIPDSFKGSMSSLEVCEIMADAVHRYYPGAETVSIPVADGGEGSVACFLEALGGQRVPLRVQGPFGGEMEAFYGLLPDGTAVVEMAACAGLPLVQGRADPEKTTTYGVGQLIAHAVRQGSQKIIVGLGGSATNDGGCGAAAALGARFTGADGQPFVPTGGTLGQIDAIDLAGMEAPLRGVKITAMCDIDNPLCGPSGAAHVFGPQKGADAAAVARLDAGLAHLAAVVRRDLGKAIDTLPGAGAAGGMGGGMVAFFGAGLEMGIETVLDTVGFDALARDADLVFSGEGKLDSQSLRGKVVIGVARRAQAAGVPLVAVVGDIGDDIEAAYGMGVSAIFSTNRVAVPFSQAKTRSRQDLALTMDTIMRYTRLARGLAGPAT